MSEFDELVEWSYSQMFDYQYKPEDYWLTVFLMFLWLLIAIGILMALYWGIHWIIDSRTATTSILTGTVIDKKYIGEQSQSGVGTAIVPSTSGGVGVGIVSTSSRSSEQFIFFVKADKIYKIDVDMQVYYSINIGNNVSFELRLGGLSKDELDIKLLAV